jgi:hypothetical protein
MKTMTNAAATTTEIRGVYMGGAHHEVGSLSRKRYTQCVGQQPKGHQGNSGNTGGDPHRRRQGRECEGTNGAAGRQTQLEELKNTNTRGARQLESRLDLHARGTETKGGASAGTQRHLAAGVNPLQEKCCLGARRAASPRGLFLKAMSGLSKLLSHPGHGPEGLGIAHFSSPVGLKKRRSARCPRVAALVQLHPPPKKHRPGQLAAHIALGITWGGLVGGRGHPPEGPIARARQPFRAPH